jgi:hypothetical protein
LAQGEKAVANADEDSLTLATAASIHCLDGCDRSSIDGLFFASTTMPYLERQNAGIIAGALNLRDDVRAADFSGALKSGTSALLSAFEAVEGTIRHQRTAIVLDKPGLFFTLAGQNADAVADALYTEKVWAPVGPAETLHESGEFDVLYADRARVYCHAVGTVSSFELFQFAPNFFEGLVPGYPLQLPPILFIGYFRRFG